VALGRGLSRSEQKPISVLRSTQPLDGGRSPLNYFLAMLAGVALAETINFHNLTVGPASPPGWNCTQTGEGDVKWSIVRDDYPPNFWNVLEQTGIGNSPRSISRWILPTGTAKSACPC